MPPLWRQTSLYQLSLIQNKKKKKITISILWINNLIQRNKNWDSFFSFLPINRRQDLLSRFVLWPPAMRMCSEQNYSWENRANLEENKNNPEIQSWGNAKASNCYHIMLLAILSFIVLSYQKVSISLIFGCPLPFKNTSALFFRQ